jgi:hypothetical protein
MSFAADPADWVERAARNQPSQLFLKTPAGRHCSYASMRSETARYGFRTLRYDRDADKYLESYDGARAIRVANSETGAIETAADDGRRSCPSMRSSLRRVGCNPQS